MTMSQKTESNQSRTAVKVILIHFWFLANVPILRPLKTTENVWFLLFSGGVEWDRWPEMG